MKETPVYTFESSGLKETGHLASALAEFLLPGSVLALDGDLGAGKTAFSQALAAGLGVRDLVNSPTFTLIKEYVGERMPFYHMDVYRLTSEEAGELGLDDYFYGSGVTLVEWAERIKELLPDQRLHISIEYIGPDERRFLLTPVGEPYQAWCIALKRNGVLT
ncbi:MAG: tRNA (adenosine(37)-N6)-threonylcarbamoyltransferase complex ATPase subunit type 1 TsaE [Gorillibacterium sp.]|nr:tRNA (adenosine(37)-N6)-threonylcarbamoyltransferase complex ATPase subunit type 1 TsaE [Gorillibacterium sp.]